MFCAGRVVEEDLKRTMKACGGAIQTSVNNMTEDVLGRCELFEEEQIGGERYAICRILLYQPSKFIFSLVAIWPTTTQVWSPVNNFSH